MANPPPAFLVAGLLYLMLAGPVLGQDDSTGAGATPVPFPEAPPLPAETDLQDQAASREAFLERADAYIVGVQRASERYRAYLEQIQSLVASCELRAEVEAGQLEADGFGGLVQEGTRQCREWVSGFDEQARAYAARLDEVLVFQRALQRASEVATRQLDRIRMMQQARRLKDRVDRSLAELEQTRQDIQQWMD